MPQATGTAAPVSAAGPLSVYRPPLDRALFVLSLVGILVVVHLALNQRIGFSRGCLGFTTSEAVEETFNCEVVTGGEQGKLLGVSNTVWGFLFYFGVAFLGGALVALPGQTALFKRLRAAAIGVGFVYALYLVYVQFFVLHELCALCLTSATIIALMAVLTAIDLFSSNTSRP